MSNTPNLDALRAREGESPLVTGIVEPAKKSALAGQFAVDKGGADAGDLEAYAEFTQGEAIAGDSLAALASLGQELVQCERNLRDAVAKVVIATKALEDVQERRLPDLMESTTPPMTRFDFKDSLTGLTRTIELHKDKFRVSLPPKSGKTMDPAWAMKHEAVYEWLVEINQGAVIKKDLEAPLGLMTDEQAAAIAAAFKEKYPTVEVALKKYVEPATLTALVTKMKLEGKNVNEYIVAKPVREAKVKGAK